MFFFIEPEKLSEQDEIDAYGPISMIEDENGNRSSVNPELKYNITSRFKLSSEAKAFACVDGQLIVQQSDVDDSLVNLIIKPCFKLNVPIEVEYYIYRGILKSSLIDEQNNCILPQGSGVNDLINRIWQDPPSDISYGTLGYDDGTINGNVNIEDIFNFLITGIDSIYVTEGEWFGTFSNIHKIGFEVILKTNKLSINLDYVRSSGYEIDVTNLSGFNERIKREEILNFIDPAALYGMHFNERVKYYDESASNNIQTTTTNANSNKFIYTKLIEKFYSKNRVYIDIRSEKGYSYNFYQNYKVSETDSDSIRIRTQTGNTPLNAQEYHTYQWPILILTATHSTGNENSLKLSLRIDDNIKPILYTETNLSKDKGISNDRVTSRYFKTAELIDNGNNPDHTAWTNMFRILFPNTQSGTSREYVSNYVKMNYYRSEYNEDAPNAVLKNEHYYNSSFCSIDIPSIGDVNAVDKKVESSNPIYVREPNNHDGSGNFQLNMINGAYWDSNRVLFYSTIQYENTALTSGKEFINTYPQKLDLNSSDYGLSELKKRTEIICREYEIATNNVIRIPGINFYKSNDLVDSGKNHKENAMLLGLTVDEFNSLKNDSQLSNLHQRFIYLGPDSNNPFTTIPDTDNDNAEYRYYKYTVQLQGFDSNGNRTIATPSYNSSAITVYSRDNQFFSSTDFSVNERLTAGQNGQNEINRIEFHIYHDGVVKINDNVDFALPRGIENIYYFYYNHVPLQPLVTEICNLEMVIADKMKRNVPYANTGSRYPNEFVDGHNYNDDAIDGVSAGQVHLDPENGDVVIEGTTVPGNTSYGIRRYIRDLSSTENVRKIFMVKLVTHEGTGEIWYINNGQKIWRDESDPEYDPFRFANTDLNIDMRYANTVRLYANPVIAAGVMGALVRFFNTNQNVDFVESQGFAYPDGTSYPSTMHVNGLAFDITYKGTMRARGSLNLNENQCISQDGNFLSALYFFGYRRFLIGQNGSPAYGTSANYVSNLNNNYPGTVPDSYHEDHIHADSFNF